MYKKTLFIFTLLLTTTSVSAAPPLTKYTPGETIDPNCSPGQTNCDIEFIQGDTTDDAFINNSTENRVELTSKSDGTPRDAGTEFVVTDDGRVGVGTETPEDRQAHLVIDTSLHPHPAKFYSSVPATYNTMSFNVDDGTNSYGTTNTMIHEFRARSTTQGRGIASIRSKWIDDVDATRVSQMEFLTDDYSSEGTGFNAKMGIYGGYVGINTRSPETVLQVAGNRSAHPFLIDASAGFGMAIRQDDATAGNASRIVMQSYRTSDGVQDWASLATTEGSLALSGQGNAINAPHLVVTNSGYVGIGTSTPNNIFHVANDVPKMIFQDTDATINVGGHHQAIQFTDKDDVTVGKVGFGTVNQTMFIQNGNTDGTLRFSANSVSGAGAETDMIIKSDGSVGIGTIGPSAKLDVDGIVRTSPRASAVCDGTTEGGIYYDIDDSHFYGCNGAAWIQLDN